MSAIRERSVSAAAHVARMPNRLLLAAVLVAAAIPSTCAAHAAARLPRPNDLGTLPGGSTSAALAFAGPDWVVGWATDTTGTSRAVRWTHRGAGPEALDLPASGD